MPRNLCLFAHYDREGIVDPYVLRYLTAISACGFDIVLISTNLAAGEADRLRDLCRDVLVRKNSGLDFGSWQAGFHKHGASYDGELLLANDSVYGPIGDLAATLERLRRLNGDVSGMVQSYQHAPHLQSWFVLLSARAQKSEAFARLIGLPFASLDKGEIIERGEIGLTATLREAGFRVEALYPRHRSDPLQRYINPTHTLWKELIEQAEMPFLKVELLRDNPIAIANVGQWRAVVAGRAPELEPLIESHRNRLSHDWAGKSPIVQSAPFLSAQAFMQRGCQYAQNGQHFRRWLNIAGYYAHAVLRRMVWRMRILVARLIR